MSRTNKYRDWIASAVLRECELPASGYVHFFISETVPDGDWPTAPELAGSVAVFKNDGGYASYDEGGADGRTVSGEVPLTRALMTRQEDVNNIERIVAYLKTHLHWRCQLTNGSKVALEDVPSLEVRVCSAPVTVPDSDDEFPTRGEFIVHREITHGRAGGY